MAGHAWVLEDRPGDKAGHLRRHEEIWLVMPAALKAAGIRTRNILRHRLTRVGHFATSDLEAARAFLTGRGVNAGWGSEHGDGHENRHRSRDPASRSLAVAVQHAEAAPGCEWRPRPGSALAKSRRSNQ